MHARAFWGVGVSFKGRNVPSRWRGSFFVLSRGDPIQQKKKTLIHSRSCYALFSPRPENHSPLLSHRILVPTEDKGTIPTHSRNLLLSLLSIFSDSQRGFLPGLVALKKRNQEP
ncbi:hypothetical protein VNO77_19195 [Canavalia gladiata]|uniref:Uncharacterized protein n=1 Tax=Canavalia gladiata TaxID=3824 RepID=A0AAN9LQX1_CANGL